MSARITAARWREHADKFRAFADVYRKALEAPQSEFWRAIDEKNLKDALKTVEYAERWASIAEQEETDADAS